MSDFESTRFDYIDVVIDGDGNLSAEVHGAKGPACENLLDQLLSGLGKILHRKRRQAYYQRAPGDRARQRVGGSGRRSRP